MPGETLPLNQHDEASVFTAGSLLTAQNGFTGYWQAPDQGSFSYPFEGLDSDFIQVSPIANQHNVFTVLSDLFLVTGQPVAVADGSDDYVLPEVQIIDVMIWQQVQMSDGSFAYVEVGEATSIPDQILSSYYNGGLGNTSFRAEFDPEPAHHVDFPDTGLAYRIENGEGEYIDTEGGYDTTGAYFIEIVTMETPPLLVEGIVGADFHPNGRYVLMRGAEDVETVDNGFRTDAWGDGWLQRVPYGSSTPTLPSEALVSHVLTTDDHSSLTATGQPGDPAGEDARVRVYTPSGAASVSGIVHVDATATGGTGTSQGGSGTVIYDAPAYSGRDITLTGRAQGGDGPTMGTARAEISDGLFSMGLAVATSTLTFNLSAIGGTGSGGSRGQSTVVFHNNSVSGWGGVDLFDVTLGRSGENAGVDISDNSFAMGEGNDQLKIVVNGDGVLTFAGNSIQGGDGFDIFQFDAEHGVTFSLGASITGFSAFVTGLEVLRGGRDADQLNGDLGANYIQGEGGSDTITSGFGNDTIDGGAGNDTLDGGLNGSDTVTFEQLDLEDDGATVVSRATAGITASLATGIATGAGNDTLSNFENVRGTSFDDRITGDGFANVLNGLSGSDTLNGGDGDDVLIGGPGNDTLVGGNGFDTADYSAQVSRDLFDPTYNVSGGINVDLRISIAQDTGAGGIDQLSQVENLIGTGWNDTLFGDDFANYFVGGAGNDILSGGGSSDTLDGGSGNDRLDGGSGADAMKGGSGDDIYIVENSADIALETSSTGGVDLVQSSAAFTLGANVENLTLTGAAAIDGSGNGAGNILTGNDSANRLSGGGGGDRLVGNGGNDTLNGGTGADVMRGGLGNDTYVVGDAGDSVIENAGEGLDTVNSASNFTLGANIENLTLTGSALRGSGNDLANRIVGNASNNILDGRGGVDVMRGGAGDDTYYADSSKDNAIEGTGEGTDTVFASVNFAVAANIENLNLTGTAVRGSGNSIANRLVGNDVNNILDGGAGADTMRGGLGDDSYYVDNAGDTIVENAGAGRERVYTTVSLTLGANLEDVFMRGSDPLNATGNGLDNVLRGNSAANVLTGGAGADDYRGGTGGDTFVFNNGDFAGLTPSTSDRIIDFSHAEGDHINLTGVDANSASSGDQAFAFIGTAAFHHTAGELRYEITNGNTYLTGDTNGDGLADFMVRLDGSHALVSGDFVL